MRTFGEHRAVVPKALELVQSYKQRPLGPESRRSIPLRGTGALSGLFLSSAITAPLSRQGTGKGGTLVERAYCLRERPLPGAADHWT